MHDLIVRGGTIVDGTGGPSYVGDVAVDGGRITSVGRVEGEARDTIDATGKLVTPGFVDVHTHYDGQVTWEQRLAPSSDHGVTSVVPVPNRPAGAVRVTRPTSSCTGFVTPRQTDGSPCPTRSGC